MAVVVLFFIGLLNCSQSRLQFRDKNQLQLLRHCQIAGGGGLLWSETYFSILLGINHSLFLRGVAALTGGGNRTIMRDTRALVDVVVLLRLFLLLHHFALSNLIKFSFSTMHFWLDRGWRWVATLCPPHSVSSEFLFFVVFVALTPRS